MTTGLQKGDNTVSVIQVVNSSCKKVIKITSKEKVSGDLSENWLVRNRQWMVDLSEDDDRLTHQITVAG